MSKTPKEEMPAEQKELLQAILYDRRNDEPKENYARWLEDNGEKLQADYIREKVRKAVDERNERRRKQDKEYQEPYLCKEVTSSAEDMSGSRTASKEKFTQAILSVINSPEIGMEKDQVHIQSLEILKGAPFVNYIYVDEQKIQHIFDTIENPPPTSGRQGNVNLAVALAMATSGDAGMPHSWVLDHLKATTFSDKRKFQILECIVDANKGEYLATRASELKSEAEKLGWDHLYKEAQAKMDIHKRAKTLERRTGRDPRSGTASPER